MNRREFVNKSSLLFMLSAALPSSAAEFKSNNIKEIAGKSIEDLLVFHRKELLEDMVPSWYEVAIDEKYGGIMVNLTRDRKLLNTDKDGYYIGRHLYMMSRIYNNHKKDTRYLDTSKKTWEFMKKYSWDNNGVYYSAMTREGAPIKKEQRIFCDIYGAYGAIEYFKASGDEEALEHAGKTIKGLTERILSPSFFNEYSGRATYPPGTSWYGVWVHFLPVLTSYLKIKKDPFIESVSTIAVNRLTKDHVNFADNFVFEVIDGHTVKPFNEPESRWVWDCHVTQAMWIVMEESLRNGMKDNIPKAVDIVKWMVEAHWDEQYGGMPDVVYLGRPDWTIWKKTLWGQVETMNALLHIIELEADPWAMKWYDKFFNYTYTNFPDKKFGGMSVSVERDGKAAPDTINMEFFHRPRYIMNTIESLERISK